MLKGLTLKLGAYALTCKLLDSMLTEIFFFVVSNVLCPMSKGYQTISMPNFITYNKSNEQKQTYLLPFLLLEQMKL